jgi:uncharacterized protein YgiM (DUF1202 family)
MMIIGFILLLNISIAVAQEDSCSSLVQAALSSTAENCGDIATGEACFGHGTIDAIVNCADAPDFASPGDILPLDVVCSMQLGTIETPNSWGVARFQVPIDDTELSATYILFGDVRIQNAGSAFSQLEAQVIHDANVYSGAGSHYDVIGSLQAGQAIMAIACNCTGNWVRVRLGTGEIAWVAARNIDVVGDVETLPGVDSSTPIYQAMQAFVFQSEIQATSCADAPKSGILIQTPDSIEITYLQINGVDIALSSTIFIQSQPDGVLIIDVLDGRAQVTVDNFTATVAAGARAIVPMTEDDIASGMPRIVPYTYDNIANLYLDLLPKTIDPTAPLNEVIPVIVGIEPCAVIADQGPTTCPLYFLNPDGNAITHMEVDFISAPLGEWEGSIRQPPELLSGDYVSGSLVWDSTCSLSGGVNFIGPVQWSITITDDEGHVSEPFYAQFNCIEG